MSNVSEEGLAKVKTLACDKLLQARVDAKLSGKRVEDVMNRLTGNPPTHPPTHPPPHAKLSGKRVEDVMNRLTGNQVTHPPTHLLLLHLLLLLLLRVDAKLSGKRVEDVINRLTGNEPTHPPTHPSALCLSPPASHSIQPTHPPTRPPTQTNQSPCPLLVTLGLGVLPFQLLYSLPRLRYVPPTHLPTHLPFSLPLSRFPLPCMSLLFLLYQLTHPPTSPKGAAAQAAKPKRRTELDMERENGGCGVYSQVLTHPPTQSQHPAPHSNRPLLLYQPIYQLNHPPTHRAFESSTCWSNLPGRRSGMSCPLSQNPPISPPTHPSIAYSTSF